VATNKTRTILWQRHIELHMFRNITFLLEKFNLQKYVLMFQVATVNGISNCSLFVQKVFLFLDWYWKVRILHPPPILVCFCVSLLFLLNSVLQFRSSMCWRRAPVDKMQILIQLNICVIHRPKIHWKKVKSVFFTEVSVFMYSYVWPRTV